MPVIDGEVTGGRRGADADRDGSELAEVVMMMAAGVRAWGRESERRNHSNNHYKFLFHLWAPSLVDSIRILWAALTLKSSSLTVRDEVIHRGWSIRYTWLEPQPAAPACPHKQLI
jgi:hypothetical protein